MCSNKESLSFILSLNNWRLRNTLFNADGFSYVFMCCFFILTLNATQPAKDLDNRITPSTWQSNTVKTQSFIASNFVVLEIDRDFFDTSNPPLAFSNTQNISHQTSLSRTWFPLLIFYAPISFKQGLEHPKTSNQI